MTLAWWSFLGRPAPAVPMPLQEPAGPTLSASGQAVAAATNRFAHDLYRQLSQEPGNHFFAPASINTALALAYGGARGTTAEEMAQVLHFGRLGAEVHTGFRDLAAFLPTVAQPTRKPPVLSVANALWCQDGFPLQTDYLQLTNLNYAAGLRRLDIANDPDKARRTINAWVEEQTRDKIKELLKSGQVTADTRLVLTNAIYMKATWLRPFEPDRTGKEDFAVTAERKVSVPMMRQTTHFRYGATDDAQIVELPYEGGSLSMVVVLPRQKNGLADLEKKLAQQPEWLGNQFGTLNLAKVNLKLPKFKARSSFELSRTLGAMGMRQAFLPNGADFSGITTSEPLFIGLVVHQAFVAVDEEGTEAAAATAITMRAGSAARPETIHDFHADHPFLYFIRDVRSGAILFMGRLSAPEADAR